MKFIDPNLVIQKHNLKQVNLRLKQEDIDMVTKVGGGSFTVGYRKILEIIRPEIQKEIELCKKTKKAS
jgi:hypothetical protein